MRDYRRIWCQHDSISLFDPEIQINSSYGRFLAVALCSSTFLHATLAFSPSSAFGIATGRSYFRKLSMSTRLSANTRYSRIEMRASAASWVDTPRDRGGSSLQNADTEGGVPWDRNAWLEGWRSAEEVRINNSSNRF